MKGLRIKLGLFLFLAVNIMGAIYLYGENKNNNNTGDSIIVTREVALTKNFTGLQTKAGVEITYTENKNKPKAIITGPKEVVEGMKFEITSNHVLTFRFPKDIKNINGLIKIRLNGPSLKDYEAKSSGIIKVTTPVKTDKTLNFAVSSSGNILMEKKVIANEAGINIAGSSGGKVKFMDELNGKNTNISLSSSAQVSLVSLSTNKFNFAGSSTGLIDIALLDSQSLNIAISSGSGIDVGKCGAEVVNIAASSGADMNCKNIVSNKISATASSGASVSLTGTTDYASLNASSGGVIKSKNLKVKKYSSRKTSSGGSIGI